MCCALIKSQAQSVFAPKVAAYAVNDSINVENTKVSTPRLAMYSQDFPINVDPNVKPELSPAKTEEKAGTPK